MLTRASRLTSERDFSRLYKRGKRAATSHLLAFLLPRRAETPSKNQNTSRFGFVVSKKHASKIVMRNRIKRILRSEVRELLNTLKNPIDAVIQARPGIARISSENIRSQVRELMKKA